MNSNFRRGFLRGLSENGITPSDLERYLEKRSFFQWEIDQLPTDIARGAGTVLFDWPTALALGIGGGAGLGLAGAIKGMKDSGYKNQLQDTKDEMLIDEIRYQIEKMKRKQGATALNESTI